MLNAITVSSSLQGAVEGVITNFFFADFIVFQLVASYGSFLYNQMTFGRKIFSNIDYIIIITSFSKRKNKAVFRQRFSIFKCSSWMKMFFSATTNPILNFSRTFCCPQRCFFLIVERHLFSVSCDMSRAQTLSAFV